MGKYPLSELLELIETAHNEFLELAYKLNFKFFNPQERTSMMLYGSILELTSSCVLLTKDRPIPAVPILLKSIMEAFIDLKNLIKDPNYYLYLAQDYVKEGLKYVKNSINKDTNATFLTTLSIELESMKKDLKEGNILDSIHITEKFKQAEMEQLKNTIYSSFCHESHNNLVSLYNRHIEDITTDEVKLVFYKKHKPDDYFKHLLSTLDLLMDSTRALHKFLGSPYEERIDFYQAKRDEINKAVTIIMQSENDAELITRAVATNLSDTAEPIDFK